MKPHSFHTVEPDFFFYLRNLLRMIFYKNLIVQTEDIIISTVTGNGGDADAAK